MSGFAVDRLVFGPDDVDLTRSPLASHFEAETYVLGAFNPALTRLPSGNLGGRAQGMGTRRKNASRK